MISPWFFLCCAAISVYMSVCSPRYNRTFAILIGVFVGLAAMRLGLGQT